MNEFEMLMGLGGSDQADYSALADQMRRRNQGAQMMMLSPTAQVSNLGKANYNQAYDTATRAGAQRNSALARARQAERDRVNDQQWEANNTRLQQKHDRDMSQIYDFSRKQQFRLPDGSVETRAPRYDNGQVEVVPNFTGIPYETSKSRLGGSGKDCLIKQQNGVWGKACSSTGTFTPLTEVDPDEIKRMQEESIAYETALEGSKAGAKESAKSAQERVNDAYGSMKEYRIASTSTRNGLRNMRSGLESGANVGTIYNQLPTWWSEATSMFDTGRAQLGLGELKNNTLTPVSDKDIDFVFQSASPNLSREEMLRWVAHKEQSMDVLDEMNSEVLDFINTHKVLPSEVSKNSEMYKEVEALNSRLEGIRSGFDFQFHLSNDEKQANIEKLPVPSAYTNDPQMSKYWNELTAEQQAAWMKKNGQ